MAVVIVLAVLAALMLWTLVAVGLALLTGGLIHQREVHDDRPFVRAAAASTEGLLPDDIVRARVA